MKIQCPDCNSVYNLDPSRIPEKGATATCKKCNARIPVVPPQKQEEEPAEEQNVIVPCPSCGHLNLSTDKCAGCGMVFSKDDAEKLKIKIGEELAE